MTQRTLIGGVTATTLHQEADGTLHVEEKQDAEPILEYAKAARDHRFSADACGGMLRHEAEIPFVVFQEECRKRGIFPSPMTAEGEMVIELILRDPAYAYLRAAPTVSDPHIRIKGLR